MPAALNEYISREKVWRDLRWKIQENTALNEVHDFIKNASIDQELILYIRTNHQTYRFTYSTLINTIYYFVNEGPMQNQFITGSTAWLLLPQPPQYRNAVVQQKPIDCSREVDKSIKGPSKKQRDEERKIALEQRLSGINALPKKHKDSEEEFQNNSLKLNFKL